MNKDKIDAKILAVAGKGGVGKTSLAAVMVKLLVAAYPDKRILALCRSYVGNLAAGSRGHSI